MYQIPENADYGGRKQAVGCLGLEVRDGGIRGREKGSLYNRSMKKIRGVMNMCISSLIS